MLYFSASCIIKILLQFIAQQKGTRTWPEEYWFKPIHCTFLLTACLTDLGFQANTKITIKHHSYWCHDWIFSHHNEVKNYLHSDMHLERIFSIVFFFKVLPYIITIFKIIILAQPTYVVKMSCCKAVPTIHSLNFWRWCNWVDTVLQHMTERIRHLCRIILTYWISLLGQVTVLADGIRPETRNNMICVDIIRSTYERTDVI